MSNIQKFTELVNDLLKNTGVKIVPVDNATSPTFDFELETDLVLTSGLGASRLLKYNIDDLRKQLFPETEKTVWTKNTFWFY